MEHMQDFNGCHSYIVKDQIVAIDPTAKKTPRRPAD
jgi:hypothetical protein